MVRSTSPSLSTVIKKYTVSPVLTVTESTQVELSSDRIALRITDDGHPFNPFGDINVMTGGGVEDREIGGLGIHLVKNLMDEVSYTRRTDMNVIVLVKYLADSIPTERAE